MSIMIVMSIGSSGIYVAYILLYIPLDQVEYMAIFLENLMVNVVGILLVYIKPAVSDGCQSL